MKPLRALAGTLAAAALLAGCIVRAPTYTGGNQLPQAPGVDMVVRALARHGQGAIGAEQLRLMGIAFADLAHFDEDEDGRLSSAELRKAIDLSAFDTEKLTKFYVHGPNASRTLPASHLPRADLDGDGRLTPAEWLYGTRDELVRQLNAQNFTPEMLRTINILWVRRELPAQYERLSTTLFNLLDHDPKNGQVTKEEVGQVGGSSDAFAAATHGTIRPIEQQTFAAMLLGGRAGYLRQVGDIVATLDRNRDTQLTKTELSAGLQHPDYGGVLSVLAFDKDSLTRFELERLVLAAFAQSAVQRALVRWTWPPFRPKRQPPPPQGNPLAKQGLFLLGL